VAVGQNLLNRNPASTLASAFGLHPFLRLLYARFGRPTCPHCGAGLQVYREDEIVERLSVRCHQGEALRLLAPLLRGVPGSHTLLLHALTGRFGQVALRLDGAVWEGVAPDPALSHDPDVSVARLEPGAPPQAVRLAGAEPPSGFITFFARFDLALLLHLCAQIGADKSDLRVASLVDYVLAQQAPFGLWDYPSHPQVSRWVTFDLLRSLAHIEQNTGWESHEPQTPFQPYPKKNKRF
jgi:hypothetical protein